MHIRKITSYRVLYSILFILFGILAGTRTTGFDYPEYNLMFYGTMQKETLIEKIHYAKDPIVGLIVGLLKPDGTSNYQSVFLTFALLTAFFNILIVRKIQSASQVSIYFILYIIFLYPSLDYAAIRAGLALPLMILSFIYFNENKKFISITLGFTSFTAHFSAFTGIIIFAVTKINSVRYLRYIAIPVVIIVASQLSVVLSFFKQTSGYGVGQGTVFSYIGPVATVIAVFIYDRYILTDSKSFARNLVMTALVLACFCVGFSQVNVTVALRLLQISHYIFLCGICFSDSVVSGSYSIKLFSIGMFILPLYMRNGFGVNLWEPLLIHIQSLPSIYFG